MILAAFLGTARQWQIFARRLRKLQRTYGFTTFHATNFAARSGEFSRWPIPKGTALLHDLTDLVRTVLTAGVVVHLEYERFINEYRAPPIPRKMNLDSQFGVCFRACMSHILTTLAEDGKRHRLHIVLEDGHHNVRNCVTIFNEYKRVLMRRGVDLLGDIRVASKAEAPPCMVADFLAHSYSMLRASANETGIDYRKDAPPPKGGDRLIYLDLLPDALQQMKIDFQSYRQQAVAEWRARKAARR